MRSRRRAKRRDQSALCARPPRPSDKVKLDAPEIAENGSVVRISVSTTLGRRHLDRRFLVSENPNALAPSYNSRQGPCQGVRRSAQNGERPQRDCDRGSRRQLYSATKEVKVNRAAAAAEAHDREKHALGDDRLDGNGFRQDHAQKLWIREYSDGIDHSRGATSIAETTEVQALIPASDGFRLRQGAKGEIIPPHFIQN